MSCNSMVYNIQKTQNIAIPIPVDICCMVLYKVFAAVVWEAGVSVKARVVKELNCNERKRPAVNKTKIMT